MPSRSIMSRNSFLWLGFTPEYLSTLTSPSYGSAGKEFACSAGDVGSKRGSETAPGEGNGNRLQSSCLENPMDREEPGGL